MNVVANHPVLSDLRGLMVDVNIADEETVRWVGKLYRHYAIEGRTNLLTSPTRFSSRTFRMLISRKGPRGGH